MSGTFLEAQQIPLNDTDQNPWSHSADIQAYFKVTSLDSLKSWIFKELACIDSIFLRLCIVLKFTLWTSLFSFPVFCFLLPFLCLLRRRFSNSFIFLYFHFIAVMKNPQTKLTGSTILKGFISSLLLTYRFFFSLWFLLFFLKSQIRCLISLFL